MPRVFPIVHDVRVSGGTIDTVGNVASGNVTSKVYHVVFVEYPFNLTVASGSTSESTSVNITEAGEIRAIRVYGNTSGFNIEVRDSVGTIYKFDNVPTTSLIDSNINIPIGAKTLTVTISFASAVTSNQSFTGVICVQTRKLE
jgi:hypothetical protein